MLHDIPTSDADIPDPENTQDVLEESTGQPEEALPRRGFLDLASKWSKAILAAVLAGAVVAGGEEEAEAGVWVNRGGSWANRRGGGIGWANRRGGGGWVNGGGGGWVNRRGGGGWANRR